MKLDDALNAAERLGVNVVVRRFLTPSRWNSAGVWVEWACETDLHSSCDECGGSHLSLYQDGEDGFDQCPSEFERVICGLEGHDYDDWDVWDGIDISDWRFEAHKSPLQRLAEQAD